MTSWHIMYVHPISNVTFFSRSNRQNTCAIAVTRCLAMRRDWV